MKKLFGVITLILTVLFSSCNKETVYLNTISSNEDTNSDSEYIVKLRQQLEEHGRSYIIRDGVEVRGFWNTVKKIGIIAAADAIGAVGGNLVGGPGAGAALGAAASIDAAIDVFNVAPANIISDSKKPSFLHSYINDPFAIKIGEAHNKIIFRLISEGASLVNMSEEEVLIAVAEELYSDPELMERLNVTPNDIFMFNLRLKENVDVIKSMSNMLTGVLKSSSSLDELSKVISKFTRNTEVESTILTTYIKTASEITSRDRLSQYTTEFNQRVFNSSLSDKMKKDVAVFTAVASNSLELWDIK